jgi:enoyl-CoA hydratase/carnithine racemase
VEGLQHRPDAVADVVLDGDAGGEGALAGAAHDEQVEAGVAGESAEAALELMLTGRVFDAAEAERMGLLTRRVPAAELDGACNSVVEALLGQSGAALRLTKRAARAGEEQPFGPALTEAERIYLEELTRTADMHEGIAAFLGKRKPDWQHK